MERPSCTHDRGTKIIAVAALLLGLACNGSDRPAPPDTVQPAPPVAVPDTTVAPRPASAWDSAAGPALFVHAANAGTGTALVVLPDVTGDTLADTTSFDGAVLRNMSVEMFARSGRVGQGQLTRLAERGDASACVLWPTASVAGTPSDAWAVGFQSGRAAALAVDSIETLASQDSASLAASLTRIASALPNDTAAALRGVPFSVRSAYRFSPAPGVSAVAAHIVRKLTIEANPVEEHILLVAERDSAGGAFRPVYSERTSGSEESVETTDVMAAVALGRDRQPTLVLERTGESSRAFALLERTPAGRWHVRWTSVYTGC